MKKTVLLLIVVLCGSMLLKAQDKAFQFGFKIAPNMGWVKPNAEEYTRDGLKGGFNWGFVGEFYLMENYALNTGFNVLYLNGGYEYPYKQNTVGGASVIGLLNRELHAKYIQLPIILKMKTNDFDGLRFYGEMGFGLGFLVDAKADDRFTVANNLVFSDNTDVSNEYRFTRESLILGAGVEYPLGGSTFITAGIRFDNNFIDILKDQNTVDTSVEQKAISNFIEIQIGLLF